MTRTLPLQKLRTQFIGLIVLSLLVTACSEVDPYRAPVTTPRGAHAVDPLFREFYDHLGGSNLLGPAITNGFDTNGERYQYVQAACFEYNPAAPESERYRLAPLGLEMNITEPSVPAPEDPDALYINGHVIYQGFVALYRKLGGVRYVGQPLTEVHYNPDKKRYEQYFENLGFFWLENRPTDEVGLLAYGSWKCADQCAVKPPVGNEIVLLPRNPGSMDDHFAAVVSRLGSDLTGIQLTPIFQGEDGLREQVFATLVIAIDPQNPAHVSLRPLPLRIGILASDPVLPNAIEGMAFWSTDGELGHNVPQVFIDYILMHGGTEISGNPISELFLDSDQIWRQCFTNYCLDYKMGKDVPDALRIRPAPLGHTYKELFYHKEQEEKKEPQVDNFIKTQELHEIRLQVWERHPFVSSNQAQKIGASLFENNKPLQNVEPILTLTMPDGNQQSVYFPPTGNNGQTTLKLDAISAPNGTLVPYQVCVISLTGERFCVMDSFVIWNNE